MQYGGIFENFETDTLNPFFVWVNNGENKWEYCDDNAYEGLRCFISNADTAKHSQLRARLRSKLIDHEAKISFYYKTDPNDSLTFYLRSFNESTRFSNPEWQYGEVTISSNEIWFNWYFKKQNIDNRQAMIDDICFPPPHTAIAHAGKDVLLCKENPVELNDAYAYFCDSVRWITDGDGRFENNTLANTMYHPGSQDLANGHVSLTILAFSGTDTLNSTTKITMLDEINFSGNILGDSLVNKYSEPVSHYSIEEQEGIIYHWDIEPTEAGTIYDYGNEIDIVWNLHEGDAEVTLSVTAENSCEVEPITKTISLIGYSTPEWQSVSFDLFPNPTTGTVNLVMGENLNGKTVVEVYNLLGEHLLTQNACNLRKGQTLTISLNGFVSGLYIITLRTENGCWSKKVSVK